MDERRIADIARALGTEFASCVPCAGGNSSVNFKAQAKDGRVFFVKFVSGRKIRMLLDLYAHVQSPLVPSPIASGIDWMAFPWRAGRPVHPADMTEEQLRGVVDAVAEFHRASGGLRHGDLHYRNLLFEGDRISTVCDIECMREGTPTDDLLRLFVHAFERTRIWQFLRLAKMWRRFESCLKISGYSKSDWLDSIDRYEEHKLARRLSKKSRWAAEVERILRGGLYRSLRQSVCQMSH